MKRLLVVAQWQSEIDRWAHANNISPRHIKRVMGVRHAAGWSADSVAIVFLTDKGCDGDAFPYLNILQREGAPLFDANDVAGIKGWLAP